MSSPSKRRLEPKKRDTLIEALEALDLNGDDNDASLGEIKGPRTYGFAPKSDRMSLRNEERFTIVLDDASNDPPDDKERMYAHRPELSVHVAAFKKAVLLQFRQVQFVSLTDFEQILAHNDAVHELDVRTVFVMFEWELEKAYVQYYPVRRRMAIAMDKYQKTINVPLPADAIGWNGNAVLLCITFTSRDEDVAELAPLIRDNPRHRIPYGNARYPRGANDGVFDVFKYPFIINPAANQQFINRHTVQSLLRYFYDAAFYYDEENMLIRKEAISTNNAARALQEIINMGLAESLPKTLGIALPPKPWDHVSLGNNAATEFVRRNPIYDPRLFLLIWGFVYSDKNEK